MEENEINEINNKNKDYYNIDEMIRFSENKRPKEIDFNSERKYMVEFSNAKNKNVKIKKTKQKLITTFVLGLVALSSVVVMPDYVNGNNIIDDYKIVTLDNGLIYYFDFAEGIDYSNLEIVVYNDFIKVNNLVDGEFVENYIDELKPNLQYIISVTNKGNTVFKKTIITKEQNGGKYETAD